jgi:DNA-3-methyladenine glycosylase II
MTNEELIQQLAALKGIGQWTVEMFLIYTLERMDILPVDDFAVREGYRRLKSLEVAPKPKALEKIGEAWSPYRTIAAWYLWRVPRTVTN